MCRIHIVVAIVVSMMCVACTHTVDEEMLEGNIPSVSLIYSTGGYVPIITTVDFYYERSVVFLDSGYCRGGRRLLSQEPFHQFQTAIRELAIAARATPQTGEVEAPSLQLITDGTSLSLPDTSASIPEGARRALDSIDNLLRRFFGKRCTLDEGRPWKYSERQQTQLTRLSMRTRTSM